MRNYSMYVPWFCIALFFFGADWLLHCSSAGWWRTGSLQPWTTSTLHGPPSGNRLRPAAGWWRTGSSRAWTTSRLHGLPSGSQPGPAAGWWRTGCSHPAADFLLAVGGTCAPLAVAEAQLYAGHCLTAGSCRLLVVGPLARCYLPGNRAALHLHHILHGAAHHKPCSGGSHTHLRL